MIFYAVVLAVLLADQFTKLLIQFNMNVNQTFPIISGIFDITYVQNTGAAFGIFAGKQALLTVICSVMILAMVIYARKNYNTIPRLESFSIALIVSGGLGNLISRTMYGYVVDFFNFYFWPVFNVADIAICVGCGLLVLSVLILQPIEEKKFNR